MHGDIFPHNLQADFDFRWLCCGLTKIGDGEIIGLKLIGMKLKLNVIVGESI